MEQLVLFGNREFPAKFGAGNRSADDSRRQASDAICGIATGKASTCSVVLPGRMRSIRLIQLDKARKMLLPGLLKLNSKSSDSRRRIWISLLSFYPESQNQGASGQISTHPITSGSSAICRGIFRSTATGTISLLRPSREATTEPAPGSAGVSATENLPDAGNE